MGAEGDVSGRTRAKSRRSFAAEVGIQKKRRRNGSMSEDETTCDSPSKPKPIKIEPIIFKDDSLTKGGSLNSSGMVLKIDSTRSGKGKATKCELSCRIFWPGLPVAG